MSRTTAKHLFSIGATFARCLRHQHVQFRGGPQHPGPARQSFAALFSSTHNRLFSSYKITRNLELTTKDDEKIQVDQNTLTVKLREERPLVVILAWIAAKKKHVEKFSSLYLNNGYDVLVVPSTALQILFPVRGSQVVAEDLLKFLAANPSYKQVVVHGFSVGGYLWGEVCLKIHKYPSVPQQLIGQVWDSLVDVIGAGEGVAAAVFPKSELLRKLVLSMIQFHFWIFHNVATKHYHASSACFYDPPVKVPSLMFLSHSDTICSFKESLDVAEKWRQHVKVTVKIWDRSPHVGHLRSHMEEYIFELNKYLQSIKMPIIKKL